MGFFSAVKKFFGGGTEETKETQAAAVEKEAAATSVAPEEPAADTGSAVAEPESTPEPLLKTHLRTRPRKTRPPPLPGMSNRWRRKLKPRSRMGPWWKCPPLKAMALPPVPQRRAGASRLP